MSGITFSLSPGEFTAVVGPSGCGKSTLLSLIAGLMRAESGEILLNGAPLTENSSRIGYMLQHDYLFEWRTVYRNIILGAEINGTLDDKTKREQRNCWNNTAWLSLPAQNPLNFPEGCGNAPP